MKAVLNSAILTAYRIFSILTLYAVLAGVLVFALGLAFYVTSRSWIVPVIVSQEDREVLDLTAKLVATQAALENLILDIGRLKAETAEAEQHKNELELVQPLLRAALLREEAHHGRSGKELTILTSQKVRDNEQTRQVLGQLVGVETLIDKELSLGLITKADAFQAKAHHAKTTGDFTDSQIAAVLLKDNVLAKSTANTDALEVRLKTAELASGVATLENTIADNERQIASAKEQIARLEPAIRAAKETPYYVASQQGKAELALVPYDNQTGAVVGGRVFACRLSFVICRQVGEIQKVFPGEHHGVHPLFRTDVRGFVVHLKLADERAARAGTLFLSRRPLFF